MCFLNFLRINSIFGKVIPSKPVRMWDNGRRGVMESIIVRKATEADVPALAETAVWAFEKDPLIMWLGNSPEDRHDICRMMMKSDWRMNSKFDLIYCEDQCRGFAVWMPPDARHSFFENMRMMLDMASVMKGTRRAWNQWQLFRRIDGVHPKKAHYYLSFLGVTPIRRGRVLARR